MLKHDSLPPSIAAPGAGWKLIAKRRFTADQIYHCGCEVEPTALGKNFAAFLSSHYVGWFPPGTVVVAKPSPLPEVKPVPRRPDLEFVHDADPERAWELSGQKNKANFIAAGFAPEQAHALVSELMRYDDTGKQIYMRAEKSRQDRARAKSDSRSLPSTYRSL